MSENGNGNGEEAAPVALRVRMLRALKGVLEAVLVDGEDAPLRGIRIGPWKPGLPAPGATITDLGIRPTEHWGERDGQDIGAEQILRVGITLDLPANWDRSQGGEDWAAVVEGIHVLVNRWPAADTSGLGLITARVVSDEPLEGILDGGKSTHIWALEAEVNYAGIWAAEAE